MAGRPITNHSERAKQKREHMRRVREQAKLPHLPFNARPLDRVMQNWRTQ